MCVLPNRGGIVSAAAAAAAAAGMLRFRCLVHGPLVPSSEKQGNSFVSFPLLAGDITIALQHGRPIVSMEVSNCAARKVQFITVTVLMGKKRMKIKKCKSPIHPSTG